MVLSVLQPRPFIIGFALFALGALYGACSVWGRAPATEQQRLSTSGDHRFLKLDPGLPAVVVALYKEVAPPDVLPDGNEALEASYEQQVLTAIAKFANASSELQLLQRLSVQESALSAALRFSLRVRERPLQGPSRWQPLQAELDRKLMECRIQLLRQRASTLEDVAGWESAIHAGEALAVAYAGQPSIVNELGRLRLCHAAFLVLHHGANAPAAKDYATILQELEWVNENLLRPPQAMPLGQAGDALLQAGRPIMLLYRPDVDSLQLLLARKASTLAARAKQVKDNNAAEKLLELALEIWPRQPGLRDEWLKRRGEYTILNIGVRSLPKYLSPARAANDCELQTIDLLFEGLVQARPRNDGGMVFVPQLAVSLPQMVDNKRRFELKKTARWSTGRHVTSADLQKTFEFLTSPKLPGHSAELADQLEPIRGGENPYRVEAELRQGVLQSLTPFTFKVLPRDDGSGRPLNAADDDGFAVAPVGSGPYMLAGTGSDQGRPYVRFVVNPFYEERQHGLSPLTTLTATRDKGARLKIRELRFFTSQDPVANFTRKSAPLHLLLDVPTDALAKLKAAGAKNIQTLATRRVYFVAVNHRDPVLADESLRRALAHGINRVPVLSECFAAPHQQLNGPYPAGSWACCPDGRVPKDLFDRARAETFLLKAKTKALELELKYPDDDPQVKRACEAIAGQWAELGERAGKPITVRLTGLPPQQLQSDLRAHRYQLAYWHYDFPDDSYPLFPLFDPRDQAIATGSNYLGYKDDGTLVELLKKADSYRDFNEVRRLTHDAHALLVDRMPLIPLWQLDYHIAVHPGLKLPAIDPLRVFANIDEWEIAGKEVP